MRKCCIGHMVAAVPYCHAGSHACACFCSVPTMRHECTLALDVSPLLRLMPVWGLSLLLPISLQEVSLGLPLAASAAVKISIHPG